MNHFKNILVIFDSKTDNRALLDQVVELAQRNQVAIKVVSVNEEASFGLAKPVWRGQAEQAQEPNIHIIEKFPYETPGQPALETSVDNWKRGTSTPTKSPLDIQEVILQEERHSLEQFIATIRNAGIQVDGKTMNGIPFIEIIQEVLRNQHDLVMITAEGEGDPKEMLFGNTTMHLMRKCPCPVWVVKPGQPKQINRILAAVDLVPDDMVRLDLNTKIMELSTSLARFGLCELLIVHAWRMYGESILTGRVGFSTEEVVRLLQETQDAHRHWLIELLQQHPLDDVKYEAYLLKGEAGVLIPKLAQAKAVDLIVMGTVSRKGVAGLLIGNTAEKVLRRVNCSMLTVKPEGFTSPVKLEPE
jgi:nucleotide-binding universal stress UspA family protein